jgi:hypothetical protein
MNLNDLLMKKQDVSKLLENDYIVYFLFDKKEIVYVGQSKNGTARIYSHCCKNKHIEDKVFDGYSILRCKKEEINDIEAYYIMKFKPKYNLSMPRTEKYINVLNFTSQKNANKIIERDCDYVKFGKNAIYVLREDFYERFLIVTGRDYI